MSFNVALTGLNAANQDLSVTANNLANTSTVGFKGSRAEFANLFSATQSGVSSTAVGNGVSVQEVAQQFSQGDIETTGNNLDLAASLYIHQESRAIEHTFSVASGLDSMVLGEVQILGQLKDAYRIAQESGSTGPILNKLFQAAFSAAKRVRTETRIGANAV